MFVDNYYSLQNYIKLVFLQKVVECHSKKGGGWEVLLDWVGLMGSQNSSSKRSGIKMFKLAFLKII